VFTSKGHALFETIPVQNLFAGMYTVLVIQGGQTAARKFIVE